MSPLFFLLSSLNPIHSCSPTQSVPMPNPGGCGSSCPASLLMIPSNMMSGPCAVRTLRCMNPTPGMGMIARITYNGGPGSVSSPNSVNLVVTCNASGTAWIYMGIPITSVTCTYM